MKNASNLNFITLEFKEDTPYKGEIRKVGEQFEVDGSYAKNFIAQGRAVAIETSSENGSNDELGSKLAFLKEKLPELSVGQIAKNRKDVLVALAFDMELSTVPDDMSNKDIAQLIYDNVHRKSE